MMVCLQQINSDSQVPQPRAVYAKRESKYAKITQDETIDKKENNCFKVMSCNNSKLPIF
jgi:hypothetical protein